MAHSLPSKTLGLTIILRMVNCCIIFITGPKNWASLPPAFQLVVLFQSSFVSVKLSLKSHFRFALNRTRCPTDTAMWRRNSLSLSSKLANVNSNPSIFLLLRSSPKSHHHGLLGRSNSTSPESTSAADPVNWAQSGPEVRYLGPRATSSSAFDLPSLAAASALKAKEVADLAKHYGRCYWELSKARLRLSILFI